MVCSLWRNPSQGAIPTCASSWYQESSTTSYSLPFMLIQSACTSISFGHCIKFNYVSTGHQCSVMWNECAMLVPGVPSQTPLAENPSNLSMDSQSKPRFWLCILTPLGLRSILGSRDPKYNRLLWHVWFCLHGTRYQSLGYNLCVCYNENSSLIWLLSHRSSQQR